MAIEAKATQRMVVPYRDLSVRDASLKAELLEAVDRVLSHGRLILGPEVEAYEQAVAAYCRRRYAVGTGSGTDSLYLALRAIGITAGDEVITTPMSWIATFNAIALCGATPVAVDVGEDLNIDPALIDAAITPRTRAIVPVHFTGKVCDMTRIDEIARRRGLIVVEDAAQAFGSMRDGAVAGSMGALGCFSMNPMKVFGAYGEAGTIVTDDETIARKLQSLRYAGTVNREDCHDPSINGRLDTVQAAMMLVGLRHLRAKIDRRRELAAFYARELAGAVVCPREEAGDFQTYYSYTVVAERRSALIEHLRECGIETKIQHPILMPNHTAYRHLPRPHIPVAERLVERILSLPNDDHVSPEQAAHVAASVKRFYGVQ